MPPEATRAMEMLRTCMVGIVAEGMMLEEVCVVIDVASAGTGEGFCSIYSNGHNT